MNVWKERVIFQILIYAQKHRTAVNKNISRWQLRNRSSCRLLWLIFCAIPINYILHNIILSQTFCGGEIPGYPTPLCMKPCLPRTWVSPSTLDFRVNLFQHATTSQLKAFWVPKATENNLREHKVLNYLLFFSFYFKGFPNISLVLSKDPSLSV